MDIKGEELSILGFIEENEIKNERGDRLDFYNRPFLIDALCDRSRFQCYKKAAQGIGMSTMMSIKTFYAAMFDGFSSIHTFPTDDDSREFVKTKVNKMLQGNACFSGIQSDNVELKEIGDRFIYYQGTISKSGALSKTADILVQDEKDRSDQQKLKDLESRTINSKFKGVWSLSNPSVDGAGVDADWAESDKKEWFVTCSNGHAHPMTWPDSVDEKRCIFICSECKVGLSDEDRRRGKWIATGNPNAKWSGYHMTLLFAPLISAEYVLEQWNEGRNVEYFYNFILGEPYSPGDTKIERHTILDNWTPKNIITGNYFLGVDVGNIKHYVLGSEKGIVKVGTFTEWHDLDRLLMNYSPTTVMDAMPENTMAHHYKDTYQNFFINHFTADKENNSFIRWGENDKKGIVFSDRSRLIDHVVNDLLGGKILYALPSDRDFRDYVKHCGDLRRVKEKNNMGVEKYCFVAGTKVLTDLGEKNIEAIKTGDRVLTRSGYRPVVNTMNREAEVVDTGILCGTPDHPVFTNRGVQDLLSIPLFDSVLTCYPNQLSTKVLSLLDTLTRRVTQIETTIDLQLNREKTVLSDFIKKSTRITLAVFQRVLLFITKTIIHLIIRQKTWAYCIGKNTTSIILQSIFQTLHGQKDGLLRQEKSCSVDSMHGRERTKQKNSLSNTLRKTSTLKSRSISHVNGAGKSAQLTINKEGNTVVKNAELNGTQGTIGEQYRKERVYNLTIQDTPEYFANGVLVHNCWGSLTGEDHYFFATLYYWIARQTHVSGATGFVGAGDAPQAVIQTMQGFKMNIQEVLEHRDLYGRE